jgi:hypothetical protein
MIITKIKKGLSHYHLPLKEGMLQAGALMDQRNNNNNKSKY